MFQTSVFRKYIRSIDQIAVDAAWARFEAMFLNEEKQQNIRNSIEIQYQEGFCRDLFCHVLGYTINPDPGFNLKTEQKNQNASSKFDNRSADAAIILNGNVRVVIELKGCDTLDLSKVENQAFGYKAHQPGCRYVVISNFERLRFYIDTADKYLEFNLFALTKEEFTKLYLCLALTQIENDVPAHIKAESLTSETEITAKFYKDYSAFKRNLFNNIVEHNADQFDKLLLFRKTQKLLDRLIFILFCEDRGLLVANTVAKIIKRWGDLKRLDAYQPLYNLFKRHFNYIDAGHQDDEITVFGYNGGLFRTDEILDALIIDDDILLGTQKLSDYDFESDVSVDILGHIFEHSLTEIEEIQNQIIAETATDGIKAETKKTSKRKKDGVFYTPAYITKYIVENTIGRLCDEKKKELGIDEETYAERNKKNTKKEQDTKKQLAETLDQYRNWLLGLKICDPACGSGAFLNAALQFLQNEHHLIDIYKAHIYGHSLIFSDVDSAILENNLYGVDINEESVEIAKLSLWLHTAQRGRKLTTLNNNIKCGNSLIDDPAIAGDKAFNWQSEFPEVFANGGFDVVIGNPPYGASFSNKEKKFIIKAFKSYRYKFESYIYFIELALRLSKDNGVMEFITPIMWMQLDESKPIREMILDNDLKVIRIYGENVFSDAIVNTCSFLIKKNKPSTTVIIIDNNQITEYDKTELCDSVSKKIQFNCSPIELRIINKINQHSNPLSNYGDVVQGITPYDKARGQSDEIIKGKAYHHLEKVDESCGHWLDGENLKRYSTSWGGKWLSYGPWLAAPRDKKYFEGKRLLFREIPGENKRIQSSIILEKAYYGHSISPFILTCDESLEFLLACANAALISWYGKLCFSNLSKDIFPKINPADIALIPIIICSDSSKKELASLADAQLAANEQLQKYVTKFLTRAQTSLGLTKVTEKLESFYKLDFKGFTGELKKQKIKLSLRDQDEWEEYFNSYREDCTRLLLEIEENDRKIDQLVYALYGLTEEEIAVVEGN